MVKRNTLTENTLQKNNIQLERLDEVFTQVPSWNKYFLSNCGRLAHKNDDGSYNLVQPSKTEGGYLSYTLSKPARMYKGQKVRDRNGKVKTQRMCQTVQMMVCLMYCDNPYPKDKFNNKDLQGHHKDGNRTNNYFKNLMLLCKNKYGRTDHDFIQSIKKIAVYNDDKGTFYTYKDIELLLRRVEMNVLEFIDTIKYNKKLFTQDGKWDIYRVNNYFIGIQFAKRQKKNSR